MAECKHVWQGNSNGVRCLRCGKQLSVDEYLALLKPKSKPTAKPKKKKEEDK